MKRELAWCCCLASLAAMVLFIVGTATKDWLKAAPGASGLWETDPDNTSDKMKVVQAFSILAILASTSAVFACGSPLLPKQKVIPRTREWALGSSALALIFGIIAVSVYAQDYKDQSKDDNPEFGWSFILMCVATGLSAVPFLCCMQKY